MTIRFIVGAASDSGRVRDMNQDAYLVKTHAVAVADGMGGHRAGEVAARIAVETLDSNFDEPTFKSLSGSFVLANSEILGRAEIDPDLRGMGTTMCAVAVVEHEGATGLGVVNVGDSRVYRLSGEEFVQLTEDHSLVESMVREGRLTAAEAAEHPQRNIVTRALGAHDHVVVDQFFFPAVDGDRYLLCSDGLSDEVNPEALAQMLHRIEDPAVLVQELVAAANSNGGRDNITCVVLDVATTDADPTQPDPTPVGVVTPASGTPETAPPPAEEVGAAGAPEAPAPPAPKRRWWRRG